MKKVEFVIELVEKKGGEVIYAVLYKGLMSRKAIYVKQYSYSWTQATNYLKIKNADAKNTRLKSESGLEVWKIEITDSRLPLPLEELILQDPRIEQISPDSEIIKEIDRVIA